MKNYMEYALRYLKHPDKVVEHMFCTLGNDVDLNNKGYLTKNYQGTEVYDFPEPTPFSWVYPWSNTEQFQPFRKLAGCRDEGFKETAEYFIACLEITPKEVAGEWLEQLPVIREVLLETPPIEDEFKDSDDMETFLKKIEESSDTDSHGGSTANPTPSVRKEWYFDVQWSDCPQYVEDEVQQLWGDYELGNDRYIAKVDLDEELFDRYPRIYFWLKHKGVP